MAYTVITMPADVTLATPAEEPVAVTDLLTGRLLVAQARRVLT
jgi:hypothetical protein